MWKRRRTPCARVTLAVARFAYRNRTHVFSCARIIGHGPSKRPEHPSGRPPPPVQPPPHALSVRGHFSPTAGPNRGSSFFPFKFEKDNFKRPLRGRAGLQRPNLVAQARASQVWFARTFRRLRGKTAKAHSWRSNRCFAFTSLGRRRPRQAPSATPPGPVQIVQTCKVVTRADGGVWGRSSKDLTSS